MILITGSAGYIGSQLHFVLKKKNYNLVGIDNLKYSYKKNIVFKKNFFEKDISNNSISSLIRKYKIRTVIHCAAYSYVMDGEFNKKKYIENNVNKTKKFITTCKLNKVKNFVFLSSSNVYKDKIGKFKE